MKTLVFAVVAVTLGTGTAAPQTPASPPRRIELSGTLLRMQESVQRNLVEAAEKMPEEHYAFKPTAEIRPFGQVVAHIALSRFSGCAAFKGQANPHQAEKEDALRTKAQVVALLKEAGTYCTGAFTGITDDALTQYVTVGPNKNEVAKGVFIASDASHGNEVYGTMAVYLRLKGFVPPTTERQRKAQ